MLQVGPRSAGAVPGPVSLRPRRHRADRHRRQRRARRASIPTARWADRAPALDLEGAQRAVGALGAKLGLGVEADRRGDPRRRQPAHGRPHPPPVDRARPRSARLRAGGLRRRRPAARRRADPARSASARCWCRPTPACCARWAAPSPTCATTSRRRSSAGSTPSTPAELRGDHRAPARGGRGASRERSAIKVDETGSSHVADMAYLGQIHSLRVPVEADWSSQRMAEAFYKRLPRGVRQHARRHSGRCRQRAHHVDGAAPAPPARRRAAPRRRRAEAGRAPSGAFRRLARHAGLRARRISRPARPLSGPAIVEQSDTTTRRSSRTWSCTSTPPATFSSEIAMMDPVTLAVVRGTFEQIARRDGPPSHPRRDLADHLGDQRLRERHLPPAHGRDDRAGRYGLPVFLAYMQFAVQNVIEVARRDGGFKPGDVWIMNDPYLGGSHLQDVQLVAPLLRRGRAVRPDGDHRPLDGHRRQRAGRLGAEGDGDPPGGHRHPAGEALRGRQAQRAAGRRCSGPTCACPIRSPAISRR